MFSSMSIGLGPTFTTEHVTAPLAATPITPLAMSEPAHAAEAVPRARAARIADLEILMTDLLLVLGVVGMTTYSSPGRSIGPHNVRSPLFLDAVIADEAREKTACELFVGDEGR